jgi:hypothetical protein
MKRSTNPPQASIEIQRIKKKDAKKTIEIINICIYLMSIKKSIPKY